METSTFTISILVIFISIILCFKFSSLFRSRSAIVKHNHKLPPGPSPIPCLGNILLLRKYSSKFFTLIQDLHAEYGPIITLYFGSRPVIFIVDHFLAHQALVQNGAAFADRPPAVTTTKILYSNHITIFTAFHGPNWSLLRRNLVSEILHPSRLKLLSDARNRSLQSLITSLKSESESGSPVCLMGHFWPIIMGLSMFMCFGPSASRIEEKQIKEIADLLHRVLIYSSSQNKLNRYPSKLGKFLFPNLWKELSTLRKEMEYLLIPHIKARYEEIKQRKIEQKNVEQSNELQPYLDTLTELNLPEEKRKLEEGEIVSLCAEFLNGIVHSTMVVLQWTMANIVKYPDIQEKLYKEISGCARGRSLPSSKTQQFITEDELINMPYLKAVILESLRRHPPGHFILPHLSTEEVLLDGKYVVPKNTTVHFVASGMAWDEKVWEEPMAFRPERFLGNEKEDDNGDGDDLLTGNKEIKLLPFGAGRRICPGISLSMLHLQYFIANLVWTFKWDAVGEEVDMEEKIEGSVTMKTPLQAYISPRSNN